MGEFRAAVGGRGPGAASEGFSTGGGWPVPLPWRAISGPGLALARCSRGRARAVRGFVSLMLCFPLLGFVKLNGIKDPPRPRLS